MRLLEYLYGALFCSAIQCLRKVVTEEVKCRNVHLVSSFNMGNIIFVNILSRAIAFLCLYAPRSCMNT
jgi:hypothetical protein